MTILPEPIDMEQEFLVLALSGGKSLHHDARIRELYFRLGDELVWQIAAGNRVESDVAHTLLDVVDSDLPSRWRTAHSAAATRTEVFLAELSRIAEVFAAENLPLIVIENAGLVLAGYACPGCSQFGDLDLLVDRNNLPTVDRVLGAQGYQKTEATRLLEVSGYLATINGRLEYQIFLCNEYSLRVNVQWDLVARRWVPPTHKLDIAEMISRSVPVSGTAARVLAPEDALVQLTVHNAAHSYVRAPGLRLHLDVERLVRHQAINWDLFLSRVLALQVKTLVYFSLAIPRALFNTPVPDEVLDRLRPPVWKGQLITRWLGRVGLFNPDERKFSNPGFIFFTAFLYDNLRGLWRTIFPAGTWMRQRYGFQSGLLLPAYHARRLVDLTLRRTL